MRTRRTGFSIVEIMVVVAIIGIIVPILYVNFGDAREQSRDTERQNNLRNLQSALELYKNRHGRYPERCPSGHGSWSGQPGTTYECDSGANEYILGDASDGRPFSEFVQRLPQDQFLTGPDSGYAYTVNSDGSVYKLLAKQTVESEIVDYENDFRSCDVVAGGSTVPICNRLWTTARNYNDAFFELDPETTHCRSNNAIFRTTYGVWGGFASPNDSPGDTYYNQESERLTENVICKIP